MKSRVWQWVGAFAFVAWAIIAVSVAILGAGSDGWLHAARYTARFSFLVFVAVFVGGVLPSPFRNALGREGILVLGAVHGVHFGALSMYLIYSGIYADRVALAGGGIAYAFLGALVIFTMRGSVPSWLRAVGLHYILLIFALTYASRLSTPDQWWTGVVGISACLAALVLRHGAPRVVGRNAGVATADE